MESEKNRAYILAMVLEREPGYQCHNRIDTVVSTTHYCAGKYIRVRARLWMGVVRPAQ